MIYHPRAAMIIAFDAFATERDEDQTTARQPAPDEDHRAEQVVCRLGCALIAFLLLDRADTEKIIGRISASGATTETKIGLAPEIGAQTHLEIG